MGVHFNFKTTPPVKYLEGQYLADFLTDQAERFIRKHKDEPVFSVFAAFCGSCAA